RTSSASPPATASALPPAQFSTNSPINTILGALPQSGGRLIFIDSIENSVIVLTPVTDEKTLTLDSNYPCRPICTLLAAMLDCIPLNWSLPVRFPPQRWGDMLRKILEYQC